MVSSDVRIFISYRRADSAMAAGRIHDRLVARFGQRRVYMDVYSNRTGSFLQQQNQALSASSVCVVLIGEQWEHARRAGAAEARIMEEGDPVRQEIEFALDRRVRLLPILIDRQGPPAEDQLPPSLHVLRGEHMVEIASGALFHAGLGPILEEIGTILFADRREIRTHVAIPASTDRHIRLVDSIIRPALDRFGITEVEIAESPLASPEQFLASDSSMLTSDLLILAGGSVSVELAISLGRRSAVEGRPIIACMLERESGWTSAPSGLVHRVVCSIAQEARREAARLALAGLLSRIFPTSRQPGSSGFRPIPN
jgi:hypothetical protein